jgi:HlyD family secretion protein
LSNLAVNEGDRVTKGQFLLQIDPKSLRTRSDSGAASLEAAESSLRSATAGRSKHHEYSSTRPGRPWRASRTCGTSSSPRVESLEKAGQRRAGRRVDPARAREAGERPGGRASARKRATLESARYDLQQGAPRITDRRHRTRRNIQEGETAVIGTMNNAGTVLLTLADMSVIQAEVEVDETNIPNVTIGQQAKITIDALPDRTFKGHVSEIGNSPIQPVGTTAAATQTTQATNFKVVVMLDEEIPTCVQGSRALRTSRPRPGRR